MTSLGADTRALRHLAWEFDREADALEGAVRALDRRLDDTWWEGADADRFRTSWEGVHVTRIRRTVQRLRTGAETLRQEAAAQERAAQT